MADVLVKDIDAETPPPAYSLSPDSSSELCCHMNTMHPPLPYVTVRIHDVPVKALVDSGSAVSILQQRLFQHLSLDKLKSAPELAASKVSLMGPNDVPIKTFGTFTLKLEVDTHSFCFDVIVADITQTLILGNDFLKHHGMVLNYDKQSLTSRDGCILPVTNILVSPDTPVAPAITHDSIVLSPGQLHEVVIDFPHELTNDSITSVLFTPSEKLGFASISQIFSVNTSHLALALHNTTLDTVCLEKFEEVGCLTEGPVIDEVQYLCMATQKSDAPTVNEIQPLEITQEQDEKRWLSLLETLKVNNWELNEQDKIKAENILHRFRFLFALKNEPWGVCDIGSHEIEVTTDTPIKQKPRPVPPANYAELKEIIDDLLKRGLIKETNSPWASPICVVYKKDGTLRICVEYAFYRILPHFIALSHSILIIALY